VKGAGKRQRARAGARQKRQRSHMQKQCTYIHLVFSQDLDTCVRASACAHLLVCAFVLVRTCLCERAIVTDMKWGEGGGGLWGGWASVSWATR